MVTATIKGGERLASQLRKLVERATDATEVQVGWFEDATYPDGTYVALVAALNEFGTGHQPPRPFFRRMIAMGEKNWGDDLGKMLEANNLDAKQSLGQMGVQLADELQASITANTYAPLAQSTIDAKGNAQQLVDSGRMLQSVAHKVT